MQSVGSHGVKSQGQTGITEGIQQHNQETFVSCRPNSPLRPKAVGPWLALALSLVHSGSRNTSPFHFTLISHHPNCYREGKRPNTPGGTPAKIA